MDNLGAGVLEDAHELFGVQRVVIEDQELLLAKEAVDLIRQVARDLRHEVAVGVCRDSRDLDYARGVMDYEEHVVRHKPALGPHVYGEEVSSSDDVRM